MILADRLTSVATILAGLVLWLFFGLGGFWIWSWVFILVGLLWWVGRYRGWKFVPTLGFLLFVFTAVYGGFLGISIIAMITVVSLSLIAWDLSDFENRLQGKQFDKAKDRLALNHLKKLLTAIAIGLLIAVISSNFELKLDFWSVLIIGLGLALSLSLLFRFFNRKESKLE